jgi:hypothetical protein
MRSEGHKKEKNMPLKKERQMKEIKIYEKHHFE